MKESNGFILDIEGQFGNVSVGDTTASIGMTIDRDAIGLERSDEFFCGKRLDGAITLQSRSDENQKRLPGIEDAEPALVETAFDVKGYAVRPKQIKATLSFTIDTIQLSDLAGFAKHGGRLLVRGVAGLIADGVEKDDDLPELTDEEAESLPFAGDNAQVTPDVAEGLELFCCDCRNRWPYDGQLSDQCPQCESSFDMHIVGYHNDPNVNELGVYVDGLDDILVPIDSDAKHEVQIEVVKGADKRWRGGYSIIRNGRGGGDKSKACRFDDPGHANRNAAIEATLGTAIDTLRDWDSGSAAGNSRRDFAVERVQDFLREQGWILEGAK